MNLPPGLLEAMLALFSIINPVTVVPVYADLARDLDKRERNRLFDTAAFTGFGTLAVLTFSGHWLVEVVFQIHMSEFRIAGGLLLSVVAVSQIAFPALQRRQTPENVMEMGVVPMAIPFLIGPGTIVTSILVLDRDGWLAVSLSLVANFLVAWGVIRCSPTMAKFMGRLGSLVVARIFWIFLTALGIHFLLTGLDEVFSLHLGT